MPDWLAAHRERLEKALQACATREHYAPFVESPSRRHHPEGAGEQGRARFEARLGRSFPLTLPGEVGRVGEEVSPYTGEPLGVDYPAVELGPLLAAMTAALPAWRDAGPAARVGACLEILARWEASAFENAHATMHTGGQPFLLAFAGSGASSLERGLEGLAYAHQAMAAIPATATYTRSFGREAPTRLAKSYRLIPRGVAAVVTCASYPAWNAYPAILANLATGNPVAVKPHPGSVLPMAMAVEAGRAVLVEAGFDADLLTLVVDTPAAPLTKQLVSHPDVAIVDFTGSQAFGGWLEAHCPGKQVYTETSGCNAVIVESTDDLDGLLRALAHGLCLFSGQMCTAAQNVFVPRGGVRVGDQVVTWEDFEGRLLAAIDALVADPARAAGVCGALADPDLPDALARVRAEATLEGEVLREPSPYAHPEFPQARTATPLVARIAPQVTLYRREHFGPVAFVIPCDDREHALARATADARQQGSIANYVYTTDPAFLGQVQDAFAAAGASVGVNLIHQLPIHYTAAFSDFHVTGLNPAGNACLTDLAFVANRFRIVQSKVELPPNQ
jgi:phenylacetic acid degradation protein paaN